MVTAAETAATAAAAWYRYRNKNSDSSSRRAAERSFRYKSSNSRCSRAAWDNQMTQSVRRGRRSLEPRQSWTSGSRASTASTRSRFHVARQTGARKRLTCKPVNTDATSSELVTSPVETEIDSRFCAYAIARLCLGQGVAWIRADPRWFASIRRRDAAIHANVLCVDST